MKSYFLPAFLLFFVTVSFGQNSVRVIAVKANVRDAPASKAGVIATVAQGELYDVIERRESWTKISTLNGDGWIHWSAVRTHNPILASWGDPNPRYSGLSTGTGSGGGMGSGPAPGTGQGSGQGSGRGTGSVIKDDPSPEIEPLNAPLRFLYKPKAIYTEVARSNGVQGTVRLKVTFLASGQIGTIVPLTSLPDGLTERAIEAAKLIRFKPRRIDGVARTVAVTVEYGFSIY